MKRELIYNAIKTPDGTILHSKHIRLISIDGNNDAKKFQKREVILSGYLIK